MTNEWRLIVTPEGENGAWNMALDEALLRSVAEGKSPTTLRLYNWQPPTVTLGIAQPANDIDFSSLSSHGWELVRRPSGGRAILHVDELTYSLNARADEQLLAGDLLESYKLISLALLEGLKRLQVKAVGKESYDSIEKSDKKNPVCFETPSNYEITFNGKKLIGSAQARKYGGILQHGTLPINGDITRITRALKYGTSEARSTAATRLAEHALTLESVLGYIPQWTSVAKAIVEGFAESFGISFVKSNPDPQEIALAESLMKEKYLSNAWNYRI
jgi:lipoate-protein ligase A